jgi:hypothetical protein
MTDGLSLSLFYALLVRACTDISMWRTVSFFMPALSVFLSFDWEGWINLFSLPCSTHSFRNHNPSAVCITVLRNK